MNKLLVIITIISFTVLSVNGVESGYSVQCGTLTSGNYISICTGCGTNSAVQGLFTGDINGTCKVTDCTFGPGSNLNGWMCKSCNGITNANAVYSSGAFLQGTSCVASCAGGYYADSNQICQPHPIGNAVGCGTVVSGSVTAICTGCGANVAAQSLFTGLLFATTCKVTDCAFGPGANLNGWMCKSCNGVPNANAVYSSGLFLQGTSCVTSCTGGYYADSNQICQPPPSNGAAVGCGTVISGSYPAICTGCGANAAVQALFTGNINGTCKVTDCTFGPGSNLNGWMCKSCNGITNANAVYSSGAFLQGTSCVASCTGGYYADSNQICQPPPSNGAAVGCGTVISGSVTAICTGCGANAAVQGFFTGDINGTCKVTDCTFGPGSNLNGWMCKSCNGITNANAVYSSGAFLQGTSCVGSCTGGYYADSNQICQPPPSNGADVGCGTVSIGNSINCQGCGDNPAIQSLFTFSSGPFNCYVTNCSLDPSNNLNGWMCKSCHGVINAHTAYSAGRVLQGNNCAFSCLSGYSADINQICQKTYVIGFDVACGTVSKTGIYTTSCNQCGANSSIQSQFSISINPNCKVTDCSKNPGSDLNGWMCKSCKGTTGAHSVYSAGKLLSGNACVAFCPSGQAADANNICKPSSNSDSILLTLVFTMLLLCLLS